MLKRYGTGETGAAYVCSLKKKSHTQGTLGPFLDFTGLLASHRKKLEDDEQAGADRRRARTGLRQMPPQAGCLDIWKLASELDGVFAEISLHVGGVILTPAPVDRYLPLEKSTKGTPTIVHIMTGTRWKKLSLLSLTFFLPAG